MEIDVAPQADHVHVKVRGDLQLSTIKDLRTQLHKILSGQKQALHLDLEEIGYMDSSGAAVLVEGVKWARKSKVDFKIIALSQPVHDSLELMRLLDFFGIA